MQNELRRIEGTDRPRLWTIPPRPDAKPSASARAEPRRASREEFSRRPPSPPDIPLVWGLSPRERLRRTFVGVKAAETCELIFAEDLIVDERVARGLARRPGTLLLDSGGSAVAACVRPRERDAAAARIGGGGPERGTAGLRPARAEELIDRHDPLLRKAAPPVVARVTATNAAEIEAHLFHASYKGVTDFVTAWVWPRPARAVTRLLARAAVTPNTVTAVSWVLVVAATFLFARGEYGWGLCAAWWMTFLDTVDGKLARVTLQSSRLGHVLDHGLDIVHPPFWYAAWALSVNPAPGWWETAAWWVIGGYIAGRLLEGLFLLLFRIETHSWRPLDSWFRTITARRNPNLTLLTLGTLAGQPALGFGAVAVWTALSLGFHVVRLIQAAATRLQGRSVEPWYLSTPASEAG